MVYSLGSAVVRIESDTSNLSRGIDGAKLLMLGLGTAAAAAAGEALKMAGNFQAGITTLQTGAGESAKNLAMVSSGILDMSVKTATSTQQLTDGLFMIESAGFHGKAGLDALQAAAEGAKVGNASLADVANGETTIMVDYASKHISAAQAVNDLIATVKDGKTHLQDLAQAMSAVLPTASAVGVGLYDVSGAMATMTGEGVDAASAATYLRQLLMALEAPAKAGRDALAAIGLTTADVANEMKISLPDTLKMIQDHLAETYQVGSPQYIEAMKNIAGGSKQMQGILDLTGQHLQTFKQDVSDVSNAVTTGKGQIDGWTAVQKDFNFQVDQAHQALDAVAKKVGMELLPIVSQFVNQDVMPAIANFQDWATHTTGLHDTFVTLTGALGTVISDAETLITDTASVVNWFQQGGIQTDLLKTSVIGLGIAVGTVKLAALAADLEKLATSTIPAALVKYGFLTAATTAEATAKGAEATATEAATTQLTLWTGEAVPATAATDGLATSTAAAATAGDTAAVSFAKLLGPIGLAATAVAGLTTIFSGLQDQMNNSDNAIAQINRASGYKPNALDPLVNPLGSVQAAQAVDALQKEKQAAQQLKQEQDQINQAWKDMNGLFDQFAGKRLLGMLNDPVGGITAANVKVMTLKEHIDDLSNAVYLDGSLKPTIIGTLSKDAETADNKIRILKSSLDDIANMGPIRIDIGEYVRVSQRDDTPFVPTIPGGGGMLHHAGGGIIGPGERGFVAERDTGGEIVEGLPGGGAMVYTGAQSRSMMGGGGGGGSRQPAHIHIHIGNREVADELVDDIANGIVHKMRLRTGIRI